MNWVRSDIFGLGAGHVREMPLEFGLGTRYVRSGTSSLRNWVRSDMSGRSHWNPAIEPDEAERPDRLDMFGHSL
jgi:hypothetical protein